MDKKLQQTISRFKDPRRVVKDSIERELTEYAFHDSYRGTVLTLTGPAIERHVRIYEPYFPVMIVAEIDRKLAHVLQKEVNMFRKSYRANIFIHGADIFEYVHPPHLPPMALLDFDFTQGWSEKLEERVVNYSERHPEAWLRVTFNARSTYSFEQILAVREQTHLLPYRAVLRGSGDPMVTAQFKPKEEM